MKINYHVLTKFLKTTKFNTTTENNPHNNRPKQLLLQATSYLSKGQITRQGIMPIHPEVILRRKNCSIGYHQVREMIVAGQVLIHYEMFETNIADLFIKTLSREKYQNLI